MDGWKGYSKEESVSLKGVYVGQARRIRSMLIFTLVLLVLAGPLSVAQASRSASAASGATKTNSGVYIVRMLEDPVVAYNGGIPGLKATKPNRGQKIDPNSANVVNYVAYLDARHTGALNGVGG